MNEVGILVSSHVFHHLRSGRTGAEKPRLYNKAAKKYGMTPVYLCLDHITPSTGKALGCQYVQGRYRYAIMSIPAVIHNRSMPKTRRMKSRLARLRKIRYVFNGNNRYSKYRIHRLLKNEFSSYLPHTVTYSKAGLLEMTTRYSSLFIKPLRSAKGAGIAKVTLMNSGKWNIQLPKRSMMANKQAAIRIVHTFASGKSYLIQEAIPLAKFKGKPYDIRVSVQRGGDGNWQLTGMVGKVARKGGHVTNVAQGGTIMRYPILFRHSLSQLDPHSVANAVGSLALHIARYLGSRLNHLADVGLDIGVTASGKPYFIELNCQDMRYSFQLARMLKTFQRTYEVPMAYAKYLMDPVNTVPDN